MVLRTAASSITNWSRSAWSGGIENMRLGMLCWSALETEARAASRVVVGAGARAAVGVANQTEERRRQTV